MAWQLWLAETPGLPVISAVNAMAGLYRHQWLSAICGHHAISQLSAGWLTCVSAAAVASTSAIIRSWQSSWLMAVAAGWPCVRLGYGQKLLIYKLNAAEKINLV